MRTGTSVDLDNGIWVLAEQLGEGGFGEVYRGRQGAEQAAIKFIPKSSGAAREKLLEIPTDARNVVPITGTGEDDKHWIIAMPVADGSLEDEIASNGGKLSEESAVKVLLDISEALVSLEGEIVHRDIKPANILLLNGQWCLADFGIARYAESATGTETHKGVGSTPYFAPELWTGASATSESDMYALGVVAYEIVTGCVPFTGTQTEVFYGHLNTTPPSTAAPARLNWVIMDCLKKAPNLRPTAEQFNDRLKESSAVFSSKAAMALGQANQELRNLMDQEEQRRVHEEAKEEARRRQLDHAKDLLSRISQEVLTTLQGFADLVVQKPAVDGETLTLGKATLTFSHMKTNTFGFLMAQDDDPFEVLATAYITVKQDVGYRGYPGRSHALWYADVKEEGNFRWYETAFTKNSGMQEIGLPVPFAAEFESAEAGAALRRDGTYFVGWPFTLVDADDLGEFVDRWGVWFAEASQGALMQTEVEGFIDAQNSWRGA